MVCDRSATNSEYKELYQVDRCDGVRIPFANLCPRQAPKSSPRWLKIGLVDGSWPLGTNKTTNSHHVRCRLDRKLPSRSSRHDRHGSVRSVSAGTVWHSSLSPRRLVRLA